MASTAFFHCLSVCGHMLTILEGLEGDLAAWRKSEADSPGADLLPGAQPQTPRVSLCGDSHGCGSEGGCSALSYVREPPSQLGYQWQILFDVVPKVQATSSRCDWIPLAAVEMAGESSHCSLPQDSLGWIHPWQPLYINAGGASINAGGAW